MDFVQRIQYLNLPDRQAFLEETSLVFAELGDWENARNVAGFCSVSAASGSFIKAYIRLLTQTPLSENWVEAERFDIDHHVVLDLQRVLAVSIGTDC